ncbi:MAG: response regulator [Bacteriovorax sp.]|nr:response regulator [Bacteriovorax sp.]
MKQILIIENDETLRKIIKLNMMKNIGCDVIEMASSSEALDLMKILPELDLIICKDAIKTENAGANVANYLKKENLKTPVLVIGVKNSDYTHLYSIGANAPWKSIVELAFKIINPPSAVEAKVDTREFVPVSIHYFLNINTITGCDVYIRVKKSESEFQYVKRLHAGDTFTREGILKYQESGLREFYIPRDSFSQFVNFVTEELVKKLESKDISGSQRVTLSSDSYKITTERIQSIGIDEYTVELVDESIASMTTLLKEQNSLVMFLKSMKANDCSFAYAHTYLCCLILHKVINSFDWQSPQIKEKLTYIAYFHDISLPKNSLTEINSQQELDDSGLCTEDKNAVTNHALQSAAIVEKFSKIPTGVGAVIKEHHGNKSGVGFAENPSLALLPLSMMFIVTENFVDEFLKIEGVPKSEDLKVIFTKLQLKYTKSTYGQTLTAIQNMIQNKKK